MEYNDFMIDYSLFLMNNFSFTNSEAYENAQSWWDFITVKNKETIRGFRINKNGKPSIQTFLKVTDELNNVINYCKKHMDK